MKTKTLCFFAFVVVTFAAFASSVSFSQVKSLFDTGKTPYKIMEESKEHYYMENVGAIVDSIPVSDFVNVYFPQKLQHAHYPKIISIGDSLIKYSLFKFDPSALKLVNEGEKYYLKFNYEKARRLFKKAIAISDSCYIAYIYIGDTYALSGKPSKALKYYNKAYSINPNDYKIPLSQGRAYKMMKKYNEALEKFIDALVLLPRNEDVLSELSSLAKVMNFKLVDNSFHPQALVLKKDDGVHIYVGDNPNWLFYAVVKAVWLGENYYGDSLTAKDSGLPTWSTQEEWEALVYMIENYVSMRKENDVEDDAYLDKLARIMDDDLLTGFILYEIGSRLFPDIVLQTPMAARKEVRGYINKYVVVR